MKKIIAYSLWGNDPMYNIGAIKNAKLALEFYPDWISRFYVGLSVSRDTVVQLTQIPNTEVVVVKESNDWTGMFWRFFGIDDSDVILFRDADSRLSQREVSANNEFLASDKVLHIMRDHPYHTERIMGGMWGVKSKPFIEILRDKFEGVSGLSFFEIVEMWKKTTKNTLNEKGIDQVFLRGIYKTMYQYSYIHDSFPNYNAHSNRHPTVSVTGHVAEFSTGFPSKYQNKNDFVGQVFDENDVPVEEYGDILIEALRSMRPDHDFNDGVSK
tara:strand:- start:362 stop:1171 length:810 start_codon:yes stop_codon:yes gene_type:complete